MTKRLRFSRRLPLMLTALALLLAACSSDRSEDFPQTALDPAGPYARDIDQLWWITFAIAVVIFVIVEAALIVSIIRFRRRGGSDDERKIRQIHGNTTLEVVWTIIPAVILAILAVPTVSTLFEIREKPTGPDVMEVTVVGHQWWWEYRYPDFAINTANELHIPAGTDVYLTLTSADVIHSFWLPALNGKRDAVPARINNLTINADEPTPPGEPLIGQCAEFCGLAHADMRLRVFVHDRAGFDTWVADQQQAAAVPAEGPAAEGWDVYQRACTACHFIDAGEGGEEPPLLVNGPVIDSDDGDYVLESRVAPDLTHFAQRSTLAGATWTNTEDHVRQWLRNPLDLKPMQPEYNDLAEGRMLGMPNLNLTPEEIDALAALLRSLE